MRGEPAGRLGENVVHFARALRRAGLRVGPGAVVDALEAVRVAGLARDDLYWTLHAVFVKRHEDRAVYDQAFRLFWRKRALLEKSLAALMPTIAVPEEPRRAEAGGARVAEALRGRPQAEERQETEFDARLSVSAREVLNTKDFAQMSAAEMAEAEARVRCLVMPLDRVATRRKRPDARGMLIDARRTLRASLRTGGTLIDLKRRALLEQHPPIVALLDISGSMSGYTRVVLHFLHALGHRRRVHVFLFGTRLTNVTRDLARRDPDEALARVSGAVLDWSGGTRISASLHAFNRDWSRRVLGQGAVVLLVTDGLERDPLEGSAGEGTGPGLSREMERLHRSCRRLVWLNPLLRFDAFEAKARGIRAMLPHVDEFRPVHNLESMAGLVHALEAKHGRSNLKDWLPNAA